MSSTVRSLIDTAAAAGSLYGWRMDAIVMGTVLWLLSSSVQQLRATRA